MLDADEIRKILSKDFKKLFQNSFHLLINSTVGTPVPMFNHIQELKYWFVPLLLKNKVRGSAILDINGKIILHGVLTPNVKDEDKLIDKNYFDKLPERILNEVKSLYPDHEVSSVFFSFDSVPQKWGWLISLKNKDSSNTISIYAAPEGWYEKKADNDSEG